MFFFVYIVAKKNHTLSYIQLWLIVIRGSIVLPYPTGGLWVTEVK